VFSNHICLQLVVAQWEHSSECADCGEKDCEDEGALDYNNPLVVVEYILVQRDFLYI
jgi:hypothetical protein